MTESEELSPQNPVHAETTGPNTNPEAASEATLTHQELLAFAALSVAASLFLWGFWKHGIYAFGLNAAAILFSYLYTVRRYLIARSLWNSRSKRWFLPLCGIAASFLLYEEPFIKVISLCVFPLGSTILCMQGDRRFCLELSSAVQIGIRSCIGWLGELVTAQRCYRKLFAGVALPIAHPDQRVRRVLRGVVLAAALVFGVVVPLLSSADSDFALAFDWFIELVLSPILELFELETVLRLLLSVLGALFLVAQCICWTRPSTDSPRIAVERDSIVTGIVLTSVLLVYVLFLAIQFERLWVGSLPVEFEQTEQLVKSGFWQLLALTCLNIALFIATFNKTNQPVQRLLSGFTVASMLLLLSSGQRIVLYVTFYGLSIEKWYAVYTVLYCGLLFGFFVYLIITKRAISITESAVVLCFWMYAFTTLLPVESVIVRSNFRLREWEGSRLNLNDLVMLSPAIAPLLLERAHREDSNGWTFQCPGSNEPELHWSKRTVPRTHAIALGTPRWIDWINNNTSYLAEKAWYEHNLSSLLAADGLERLADVVSCCKYRAASRQLAARLECR